MGSIDIKATAQFLHSAEMEKRDVVRITEQHPEMDVEMAYQVQEELVAIKLRDGQRIIGPKMGLTSQAKMKQMKVEEPIYGYIFDYMVVPNGGTIYLKDHIHPKVEAEIAFVMGKDLQGPGITGAQVLAATDYVLPALEIIDSRYENFKFTLPDVIADNASSSRVIWGSRIYKPEQFDLDLVGGSLSINGVVKELGAGAAVLGHPANSVAMLANMLGRKGQRVKAGDVILTGGITEAVILSLGDTVSALFDGLGEIQFSVKE